MFDRRRWLTAGGALLALAVRPLRAAYPDAAPAAPAASTPAASTPAVSTSEAAASAPAVTGGGTAGAEPPRLALLIGNSAYPDGTDLPPIPKNVRDLQAALERRGFTVTQAINVDIGQARSLVERFAATVAAAPADSTVFFYFSGHGAQVDAENLLVAAEVDPRSRPNTLLKGSMTLLVDVLGRLPHRPQGLTMTVVDA